jgi:hypothetical protein
MGKHQRWLPEEVAILQEIINKYPSQELPKVYNRKAKKLGLKKRTNTGIMVKCKRLFPSVIPTEQNYTCAELARILGVKRGQVYNWRRKQQLIVSKISNRTIIREYQLKCFKDKYPHLLATATWEGLAYLFGEKEATEIKKTIYKKQPSKAIPIRNKINGKVYKSIREASTLDFYGRKTIQVHLRKENGDWEYC